MRSMNWNTPVPPWIFAATPEVADEAALGASSVGCIRVVRLAGASMDRKLRLLEGFAEAFHFHKPWGTNWDAFDELMADSVVRTDTATLVVISASDQLLAHETNRDDYLTVFLDILRCLGTELAGRGRGISRAVSFHVLMARNEDAVVPRPLADLPKFSTV